MLPFLTGCVTAFIGIILGSYFGVTGIVIGWVVGTLFGLLVISKI